MLSWLAHWIERHPKFHRAALFVWRAMPPRLAGFLKGLLAKSWLIGAVAVLVDQDTSPPEVVLVEHSYRRKGAWGLPGGALDSIPGNPRAPRRDSSPDNVVETALRTEVWEELGIRIDVIRLLRIDAVPYVLEEPGPYRLDFYFRCAPELGFAELRRALEAGRFTARSPEIKQVRMVPVSELASYDLFSADARFLHDDLPRLMPHLSLEQRLDMVLRPRPSSSPSWNEP